MTEKLEKLKQGYANLSEWLEHIMAAIVLIAIVIAICSLWAHTTAFENLLSIVAISILIIVDRYFLKSKTLN